MSQLEIEKVIQEIRARAEDTFFSVNFIKKNGDLRKMVCRLNVKKGVKGVGMSYDPTSKGLLCVFDVVKNGFRMIVINTIQNIKIRGNRIEDITELV